MGCATSATAHEPSRRRSRKGRRRSAATDAIPGRSVAARDNTCIDAATAALPGRKWGVAGGSPSPPRTSTQQSTTNATDFRKGSRRSTVKANATGFCKGSRRSKTLAPTDATAMATAAITPPGLLVDRVDTPTSAGRPSGGDNSNKIGRRNDNIGSSIDSENMNVPRDTSGDGGVGLPPLFLPPAPFVASTTMDRVKSPLPGAEDLAGGTIAAVLRLSCPPSRNSLSASSDDSTCAPSRQRAVYRPSDDAGGFLGPGPVGRGVSGVSLFGTNPLTGVGVLTTDDADGDDDDDGTATETWELPSQTPTANPHSTAPSLSQICTPQFPCVRSEYRATGVDCSAQAKTVLRGSYGAGGYHPGGDTAYSGGYPSTDATICSPITVDVFYQPPRIAAISNNMYVR